MKKLLFILMIIPMIGFGQTKIRNTQLTSGNQPSGKVLKSDGATNVIWGDDNGGTNHDSLTIAPGSTPYFEVNYPQIFSGQKLIDSLGVMNTKISGKEPLLTKGNLTAGSSKVTIVGTGTNALIGSGASVDVNEANIVHQNLSGHGTNTHAQIDTHITNDADLSPANEFNTSVVFNKTNNKIEITDAGGTKSDTIEINQDILINGYSGTINVITNPVAFNWPVAYANTNYYLDIFAHYTETIDGKSVLIRNAVYDFIKTTTGFSLKLDTLAGVVEYRASRTINSETPANVLLQSDLTTTVGSPGSDTKIPTEKAVRTALSGVVVTETDPVYSASSWFGTTNNSTNWNTSYTDRLKWDGGSTGLTAATGRSSLGGTTIGQAMFTSTNPSAVTFGRANADNTFSWLNASDFKTAIGGGTTSNSQTIKFDTGTTEGTDLYTFNGSESKTVDIKAGTNITLTKVANSITVNASGGGTIQEKWTSAVLLGSGLGITSVGLPALAVLNGTDVALFDDSNDQLRTYRFNGATWSLVGSGLAISTVNYPALAALNGTDVAFIDYSNDQLRTYRFNGATWSLVGSGLAISTVSVPALAALNGTDVAFIDYSNAQLRTYRFNGSTWSLVGSGLAISTIGNPSLAALNGTDVALFDDSNDQLRTYRFNGATWSLVGSGLAISTVSRPSLAALNGTDVAFIDYSNDQLRTYRFNGGTWSLVGSGLAISTVGSPALAALNGTDVAFIDDGSDQLRTYRFGFSLNSPYHP